MLVLKTSSFIVASMLQLAPALQQCCHRFALLRLVMKLLRSSLVMVRTSMAQ
jgi:hypothetical protein